MTTAYRDIEPATVLDKTGNRLCIPYVLITPFTSAEIHYEVCAADNEVSPSPSMTLMSGVVSLTGDDYANWNDDDTYLYTKLAEKLGLTLIPLTPP